MLRPSLPGPVPRPGSGSARRHFGGLLQQRVVQIGVIAPGQLLERLGDRDHRRGEVRDPDEGQQQPDDPEDMIVGEERDQRQQRHDLHLHHIGAMRHALGQSMQPEVEVADQEHRQNQKHRDAVEEPVGLTRRGDENRQMLRRDRMQQQLLGCSHLACLQGAVQCRRHHTPTTGSGGASGARFTLHHDLVEPLTAPVARDPVRST